MLRRLIFPIALLLLLIGLSLAYFDMLPGLSSKQSPISASIPSNAVISIGLDPSIGLERMAAAPFSQEIMQREIPQEIRKTHALWKYSPFLELPQAKAWVACVLPADQAKNSVLSIFQLDRGLDEHHLALLQEAAANSRSFHQTQLYELEMNEGQFTLAVVNGQLLLSSNPVLVEQSIAKILASEVLSTRMQEAGSVDPFKSTQEEMSLILNLSELKNLSNLALGEEWTTALSATEPLSELIHLKLIQTDKGIRLQGQLNGTTVTNSASSLKGLDHLPDLIAMASVGSGIDDAIIETLGSKDRAFWTSFAQSTNGWFISETHQNVVSDKAVCFIWREDAEGLEAEYEEWLGLKEVDQTEAYRATSIHHLRSDSSLAQIFGGSWIEPNSSWSCRTNNWILFAEDKAELKKTIDKLQGDQLISARAHYQNFRERMSEAADRSIYINGNLAKAALSKLLAFAPINFSQLGLQFIGSANGPVLDLNLEFEHLERGGNEPLWSTVLDTAAFGRPHVIWNHSNKQKQVLITDAWHNLYLLDRHGAILWKRKLDGPILGEVSQIDFYNNDKLQIVFNTPTQIYLLDRLGRDVAEYPIRIGQKASAGMLVVNYDDNKEYRFFVPAANGNIYGYEWIGKPLNGWNPKTGTGLVPFPMQHVLLDGVDYLVAINKDGKCFVMNRRGENRFVPLQLISDPKLSFPIQMGSNDFELILSSAGRAASLNSKGEKQEIKCCQTDSNALLILGANGKRYSWNEKTACVCSEENEKLHELSPEGGIEAIIDLSKDGMIGIIGKADGSMRLYDTDLKPRKNEAIRMPLVPIVDELFQDGSKILILGDTDAYVKAYRL